MTIMHNNPNAFFALFLLMVVVLIAEIRLSAKWKSFYFMNGPVIFSKKYTLNSMNTTNDMADKLDDNFAGSYFPSIIFKNIDHNVIAFREKLFEFVLLTYTPVMHGAVIVDDLKREVSIKGRVNWFPLVFSVLWVIGSFDSFGTLFIIGLMGLLYCIQYYRFTKVSEAVLNIMHSTSGT